MMEQPSQLRHRFDHYPTLLVFVGIIIHLTALYGYPIGNADYLTHVLMFVADVVVFWGLIYRTPWGYYLAVILFLHQSVFQTKWAIGSVNLDWDLMVIAQFVTAGLVIVALTVLITKRRWYLNIPG